MNLILQPITISFHRHIASFGVQVFDFFFLFRNTPRRRPNLKQVAQFLLNNEFATISEEVLPVA